MKTAELRKMYLDYFVEQGHLLVPSSSLVPYKDPSVLLTTAGMQQFKPYFMGLAEPPAPRMASVQKCFRTSDIDKVGLTARHCTFFEMLGNFSIGDYFKEGAIRFAWEFSLDYLRLDQERIWISYFEGDDAIEPDDEAIGYWTELGVPRERMVGLPRSANFWGPVGPSGPCGPCSELYYDRGPEYGCSDPDCRPGCDCDRYVEYWNLVFTGYNMDENQVLTPLPAQNIDTGMGLERIAALKQNVTSVFLTDALKPLIELGEEIAGKRFGDDRATRRRPAGARRPLTGDDVPGGRRSAAEQRGPGLRAAPRHPPGGPFQPVCRHGAAVPRAFRREGHRADGRGLSRTGRTPRQHPAGGPHRGRAIQPHARPGPRSGRRSYGRGHGGGQQRVPGSGGLLAARHLRLPDRGHPRDRRGTGPDPRHGRLRGRPWTTSASGPARRRRAATRSRTSIVRFARDTAHATEFKGYEREDLYTVVENVETLADGKVLIALRESPFYAEMGGQTADTGRIESEDGQAAVEDVQQQGQVQVVVARLLDGQIEAGTRVKAVTRVVATGTTWPPTTPPPTCCTTRSALAWART